MNGFMGVYIKISFDKKIRLGKERVPVVSTRDEKLFNLLVFTIEENNWIRIYYGILSWNKYSIVVNLNMERLEFYHDL